MLKRICVLLLMLSPAFQALGESWEISASEWSRPRHGDWLVRQPALVAAIEQLQRVPTTRLQIRYPGGDEGVLWAEELQSWLVALGLESDRIERVPGSGTADHIQIRVAE
ncbi:MAG: hypothetical protein OQK94_02565 [Gammaproteobacteria bacterium]|nr:hypothetical protein [Gammaproteobacteria bacterium]MCW8840951.1 hypothetical protein [Gammaproteobacteria bacterium]MCW8958187.1 hypothetical protein [Gammaproteobacteria bacterium]MCW8973230.1 hypothetical protein [Gammaproteobacteria bacterium]MCW8991736.1 hypothetical protein [Gammaproteobacteria bacterium]